MAKTNAERQAAYRKQRAFAGPGGNGERRLNTFVSTGTALALARLAKRYGVTKREMLERLINEADQLIEDTLQTDEEWEIYHNVTQ